MTPKEQLHLWEIGVPLHDHDTPQCVPDFSCCLGPEFLAPEHMRSRYLRAFQEQDSSALYHMRCMFLTALQITPGISLYQNLVADEYLVTPLPWERKH